MENAPVSPVPAAAPAPAAPEATPEPVAPRTFTEDEHKAELEAAIERRMGKERKKRGDVERERDYWRNLHIDKGAAKPETPAQPAADAAEPKREQFDSYEAYIEAKAEFKAERAAERKLTERDEKQKQASSAKEREEAQRKFLDHAQKVAKDIPDFDQVMSESEAPLTEHMAEAIREAAEMGPKIAYELAKNPGEAERIAALSPARQAAEIGKLEAKLLSAPAVEPKKPSKAPEPIKPVGGKEAAGDKEPDAKTQPEAWVKWRQRKLAAKKG